MRVMYFTYPNNYNKCLFMHMLTLHAFNNRIDLIYLY